MGSLPTLNLWFDDSDGSNLLQRNPNHSMVSKRISNFSDLRCGDDSDPKHNRGPLIRDQSTHYLICGAAWDDSPSPAGRRRATLLVWKFPGKGRVPQLQQMLRGPPSIGIVRGFHRQRNIAVRSSCVRQLPGRSSLPKGPGDAQTGPSSLNSPLRSQGQSAGLSGGRGS